MSTTEAAPLCQYCSSPIRLGARKCPACLEFLDGRQEKSPSGSPVRVEAVKGVFDLLGRAAIPVAVIAALLLFRSEISEKLAGAESVQIGSYGIKFRFPESRGGSVELDALALYYLLDTARHPPDYKGGINYHTLKTDELRAMDTLKSNGLVTAETTEVSEEEAQKRFGIRKTISLSITDKGRSFLRSANLGNIIPQVPK